METCTKVQCKQVSIHAIIKITQQKKRKEKGNNPKLTENSANNTIFHRKRKKDRSQEVACMNRIFKVVWNKARNSWMVGSELISA